VGFGGLLTIIWAGALGYGMLRLLVESRKGAVA
jgi:hypothetical protein